MFYINDFPLNILGVKLVLFADQTNIPVSDKNVISYERIKDMVSKNLPHYKY
jgi:hypothetical protein